MSEESQPYQDAHSRFELKTILETGRILIESNDLDFIHNNLLLITMGKLTVSRGAILQYDPTGNFYRVKRRKGRFSLAEGSLCPLHITEEQKEQSILHPEDLDTPLDFDAPENSLFVNLRTSNYHLGFLFLGPKLNGKGLSERERNFVESLALMSSVALSNSRMFDELKRTNRQLDRKVYELKTLFELSKDFNRMVEREQIAQTFKFAMLGQLLIRKFFFLLDTGEKRHMISSSGITEELNQKQVDLLFGLDEEITEVTSALKNQIPFLDRHKIEAVIGLRFQNEKLAVVGIGDRANNTPFTESDYNFISSMGNLALLSIQKTFLLEERIEKERLEEELEIAQSIQRGLLPSPLPSITNLNLYAETTSSRQVGGDFFDIIEISGDKHLLTIGDVTGKGVPAALLMANLQAILRALKPFEISMSEATGYMNDIIHENTPSDKFITFFWATFHPATRSVTYVNAGHNPPILLRNEQEKPATLEEGGLILGAMPTLTPYEEKQIRLEPGDLLVLYTDGVTETRNKEEEYGEQRLLDCIRRNRDVPPQTLYKRILEDVRSFSDQPQFDDLTLMILRAT